MSGERSHQQKRAVDRDRKAASRASSFDGAPASSSTPAFVVDAHMDSGAVGRRSGDGFEEIGRRDRSVRPSRDESVGGTAGGGGGAASGGSAATAARPALTEMIDIDDDAIDDEAIDDEAIDDEAIDDEAISSSSSASASSSSASSSSSSASRPRLGEFRLPAGPPLFPPSTPPALPHYWDSKFGVGAGAVRPKSLSSPLASSKSSSASSSSSSSSSLFSVDAPGTYLCSKIEIAPPSSAFSLSSSSSSSVSAPETARSSLLPGSRGCYSAVLVLWLLCSSSSGFSRV